MYSAMQTAAVICHPDARQDLVKNLLSQYTAWYFLLDPDVRQDDSSGYMSEWMDIN
jgi:hypothetical protein